MRERVTCGKGKQVVIIDSYYIEDREHIFSKGNTWNI